MPLKIVWSFIESGEGWTENYWTNDNATANYLAVTPNGKIAVGCKADNFLQARRGIMHEDAFVNHVRVSLVGTPRVTRSAAVAAQDGQGNYDVLNNPLAINPPAAEIFSTLLVRYGSGDTRVKSQWIGGIPESIIQTPQTYRPTGNWNIAFAGYQRVLTTQGYVLLGRPVPGPGNPIVPLTTFAPNILDGRTAAVAPAVGPVPIPAGGYWYVTIRGVTQPRGWNGVHRARVNPSDATQIEIGPLRRPGVTSPAWGQLLGGSVQLFTPQTGVIDSVIPERIGPRKRGRPFGFPRGRR